jgi:hypothetical protein
MHLVAIRIIKSKDEDVAEG